MADTECAAFLRWALPKLDLRWQGFRKVHGQVCKRLKRRMKMLGLEDMAGYRARLEADPANGPSSMVSATSQSPASFATAGSLRRSA